MNMDKEIISRYFPGLDELQRVQFDALETLYPYWNEKINVISRRDIDNLYTNHILHSLSIARFLQPVEGTRFMDLGTGGGFPGLPLAIMFPRCTFHLIDRIAKKLRVAQEIASAIGLENITFQHGDSLECKEKFDFVVSRAVMTLPDLLKLARRNISRDNRNAWGNGLICLKGGDLKAEIDATRCEVMEYDISTYFAEPYFATKKLIYIPL